MKQLLEAAAANKPRTAAIALVVLAIAGLGVSQFMLADKVSKLETDLNDTKLEISASSAGSKTPSPSPSQAPAQPTYEVKVNKTQRIPGYADGQKHKLLVNITVTNTSKVDGNVSHFYITSSSGQSYQTENTASIHYPADFPYLVPTILKAGRSSTGSLDFIIPANEPKAMVLTYGNQEISFTAQ
jgi:hypothetical protein